MQGRQTCWEETIVTRRTIVTEHVSWDTKKKYTDSWKPARSVESTGISIAKSNQQTFHRIPIRYISGCSDENKVSHRLEHRSPS